MFSSRDCRVSSRVIRCLPPHGHQQNREGACDVHKGHRTGLHVEPSFMFAQMNQGFETCSCLSRNWEDLSAPASTRTKQMNHNVDVLAADAIWVQMMPS